MEPDELDLLPEDEDDPPDESLTLYYDGWNAYQRHDDEKAIEYWLKSAQSHAHFKTHECLYMVLNGTGRSDEAFRHIEKAYHLNSRNNKTATMYATALVKRGDIAKALPVLADVLRRSATYGPARKLLKQIDARK